MHGGKIVVRSREMPTGLPPQLAVREASADDMAQIETCLASFCEAFGRKREGAGYPALFVLTPNSKNPYKQLYTYR